MEEDNPQGMLVLPWWVWAMVIVFCLPSILMGCATVQSVMPAAVPVHLVATFDAPNTNGKLYDEPCTNETIMDGLKAAGIPAEILAKVKAATGTYDGKEFGVCWAWNVDESGAVVVWDDGGSFTVPKFALKLTVGA